MKTSGIALWELVRCMTRNEKVFFKKEGGEASKEKDLLYIRLFDCISGQKNYDEEKIILKLTPAITKKNIAFQKHYLYNRINDSLVRYQNRDNTEQEIYRNIQLIRIKRKKGLLDEALDLWKKTMRQARYAELFSMSQLLKREFEKMILLSSVQVKYDDLHEVFRSNTLTYDYYADMITLRDIYAEIVMLRRKAHFDFDDNLKKTLTGLMEQVSAKKHGIQSPSFWHRHYTRMCLATLHFLQKDNKACFPLIEESVSDWWNFTHFIQSDTEHYLELLYMVNYSGIMYGAYEYVERAFDHPANDLITDDLLRANFEAVKYLAKNKIYNKTGQYDAVKKLIVYMKNRYTRWEPLLSAELNRTMCFSLGIASFVLDNYAESSQFIRRGVTYFKDGTREEQFIFAHLFLLLIQFNMGNSRLFEAQYKSTYAYLYKKKKLHGFEKILLHGLYDSFYLQSITEKNIIFQKAIRSLDVNADNEVQQSILNIFNFHGWLQSQVQRISYKEYVRKKNQEETKAGNRKQVFSEGVI